MAKYRKTALVEAEQFLPPHQIPEGCYQEGTMGDVASGHGEWFLKTLEGKHPLRYADYICKGVQGERWNVEVSIFEATYELASLATDATDGATGGGGVDAWREAVIDGLVVAHIYNDKHDANPRKALHDLICWEVDVALDPRVSQRAADLLATTPGGDLLESGRFKGATEVATAIRAATLSKEVE